MLKKNSFLVATGVLAAVAVLASGSPNVSAQETTVHTVSHGEYLKLIADKYGVTVDQLIEWNQLDSNVLYTGDKLIVSLSKKESPDDNQETPAPQDPQATTYTVVKGDSLWSIANKFGVSIQNLKDWNKLPNNYMLQPGIILKVTGVTSQPAPQPAPQDPQATTYTVVKGDSLWSIANKFGVSIQNLKDWNKLPNNYILQPGTILKLRGATSQPAPQPDTPSTTTYTVVRGDSFWSIARKFGITMQNIREWNKLPANYMLQPGDQLKIVGPSTQPTPPSNPQPIAWTHTVQKGDSLWLIATKYGITIQNLKDWNGLTSNYIYPGDVLKVAQKIHNPQPQPEKPQPIQTTYTVRKGDSLWLIANRFGVSVQELKQWNNLSSNLLFPGNVLRVVPDKGAPLPAEKLYTIKAGDSLWTIAQKYGVTVSQLMKWNQLDSTLIMEGHVLIVAAP